MDSNELMANNDQDHISDIFSSFFSQLFSSSNPSNFNLCLQALDSCIIEMNRSLLAKFTEKKVQKENFKMNPMGALCPDGFLVSFYQKNWPTIKRGVSSFVLKVLNHNHSLKSVNDTYITLIPKLRKPLKVRDFIPISLCNIIYKIVAKILANRLRLILLDIIYPNQSVFVLNRLISYNRQCLHCL